ncbi:MAG: lasso RiPP family leader peptide-containing protein [Pseudonocardia sp.]
MEPQQTSYEPPTLVDLGVAADFFLGQGNADTADMNTSRYW